MKEKVSPMRMCIVCRQMYDKSVLTRIVCGMDGAVVVDHGGKLHGRGAYICKNDQCTDRLIKQKALSRTFHREIDITQYKKVLEDINADHT